MGLRIDDLEAARNPSLYLERLSRFTKQASEGAERPFIWIQKVQASGERAMHGWNYDGVTGYDFLSNMNRFFCVPGGVATFFRKYAVSNDMVKQSNLAKEDILEGMLSSRFNKLGADLKVLLCSEPVMQDTDSDVLAQWLAFLFEKFELEALFAIKI